MIASDRIWKRSWVPSLAAAIRWNVRWAGKESRSNGDINPSLCHSAAESNWPPTGHKLAEWRMERTDRERSTNFTTHGVELNGSPVLGKTQVARSTTARYTLQFRVKTVLHSGSSTQYRYLVEYFWHIPPASRPLNLCLSKQIDNQIGGQCQISISMVLSHGSTPESHTYKKGITPPPSSLFLFPPSFSFRRKFNNGSLFLLQFLHRRSFHLSWERQEDGVSIYFLQKSPALLDLLAAGCVHDMEDSCTLQTNFTLV